MRKSLTTSAKNFGIAGSIWKVYALLLEHSCDADYKLLVGNCIFIENYFISDTRT